MLHWKAIYIILAIVFGVVGFIGIARSPTCGLSVGVKDLGRTIKAPMHQSLDCPTTEISSMNTEGNRQIFLERVRKYESR